MLEVTKLRLKKNAFSKDAFQILRPNDKAAFSLLMEIVLLETGEPAARQAWQAAQATNLIQHAVARSPTWRQRLSMSKSRPSLERLPVLTRSELNQQVSNEGSLIGIADGSKVQKNTTSGSTGSPVNFYTSQANAAYLELRNFAQYLMEGRDLSLNRCRMIFAPEDSGFKFEETTSYAGPLSDVIATGHNAELAYSGVPLDQISSRLRKYRPGHLVALPQFFDYFISEKGAETLQDFGVKNCIIYGGSLLPSTQTAIKQVGIAVRSSYSCEEIGTIAFECAAQQGYYHVASSNAVVENGPETIELEGAKIPELLVSGLHTYATPVLRYRLGDFGKLLSHCPCGHAGPVIANLVGRASTTLKMRNGTRRPFFFQAKLLSEKIRFEDIRIRQTALDKLLVEIVAPQAHAQARADLVDYLQSMCGPEFTLEVRYVDQIDWGLSRKRLAFHCDI